MKAKALEIKRESDVEQVIQMTDDNGEEKQKIFH